MKTLRNTMLVFALCFFSLLPSQQISALNQLDRGNTYVNPSPTAAGTVVQFADNAVRDQVLTAINSNLPVGVDPQVEVTTDNILYLTNLLLSGYFQSMSGLEYATNVKSLKVNRTDNYTAPQTDISALASMTQLNLLEITNSNLVDISPIANLVNLDTLNLSGNEIQDISALSALTKLRVLILSNNSIQDISPLGSIMPNISMFDARLQGINVTYSEPVLNGTFVFKSLVKDASGDVVVPKNASYTNAFNSPYITFSNIPSNSQFAGYEFASPLNNVRYRFDGTVTIQFTQSFAQEYLLTFDLNGGTEPTPASQLLLEGTLASEPMVPMREGYTFAGWNTSQDGSGTTWDFTNTTMPGNPVTLYAQWDINSYEVVFDLNEMSRSIWSTKQVMFGDLVTEPTTPTLDGYTFLGWNTLADGSGLTWDFAAMTMPANNMTLYAQWEQQQPVPIVYELTFNLNGGSSSTPAPQFLNEGAKAVEPIMPIREGYIFKEWNTQADGTGISWDFAITLMPASHVTLYAQWEQDYAGPVTEYQVTFILNGGNGIAPETQSLQEGAQVVKPIDPMKDGFTFIGWNTMSDGSGVTWNFETMTMPAYHVTLYAQWEQDLVAPVTKYQVTFILNGGSGVSPETQSLQMGDQIVKPIDPMKDGFSFIGWNTTSDGTGVNWDFATMTMPANDVTLYAQWKAMSLQVIEHTLTFDLNGGNGVVPEGQRLKSGTLASRVDDPKYAVYTFIGWNTTRDGSGMVWHFDTTLMPDNDVTLYAQWQKDSVPVKTNSKLPETGETSRITMLSTMFVLIGGLLIVMGKKRVLR